MRRVRKRKVRHLVFQVPKFEVYLIKVDDISEEIKKKFVSIGYGEAHPNCTGVTLKDANLFHIILQHRSSVKSMSHEANHVAEEVCRLYGIDDEEYRSYLIGYLTEEMLKQ